MVPLHWGMTANEPMRKSCPESSLEFYKEHDYISDSSVWQDVYRHKADVRMLYIKLTVIDDVLVVSFKEL
ncbi:MAG: type II toxin-antitoxin system MqsR family toxin [Bilophila wadsworthia]